MESLSYNFDITCPVVMFIYYIVLVKSDASDGRCEDVNECDSAPCQHSTACTNMEDAFLCECLPGYDGVMCELDVDECSSMPCLNNAT